MGAKMKSMILVAMLLALAAAYPLDIDAAVDQLFDQVKEADDIEVVTEIYGEPIAIVEYSSSANPEKGVYSYNFEGANGIIPSSEGQQKQIGEKVEEVGTVSRGSYSYEFDGIKYTVDWVADENGFRATGDHLPTPPPMPAHVVQLLADLKVAEDARIAAEVAAVVVEAPTEAPKVVTKAVEVPAKVAEVTKVITKVVEVPAKVAEVAKVTKITV